MDTCFYSLSPSILFTFQVSVFKPADTIHTCQSVTDPHYSVLDPRGGGRLVLISAEQVAEKNKLPLVSFLLPEKKETDCSVFVEAWIAKFDK